VEQAGRESTKQKGSSRRSPPFPRSHTESGSERGTVVSDGDRIRESGRRSTGRQVVRHGYRARVRQRRHGETVTHEVTCRIWLAVFLSA